MKSYYFEKPILWDYSIGIIVTISFLFLDVFSIFKIPCNTDVSDTVSDLSSVSFTAAGFILTFLTLLVTFKGNSFLSKKEVDDKTRVFDAFFTSDLYDSTIKKLKEAVISLILVALLGYVVKLILSNYYCQLNFLFCTISLIIIVLTLWRTVIILAGILDMQNQDNVNEN